jgi:hypothetical protein
MVWKSDMSFRKFYVDGILPASGNQLVIGCFWVFRKVYVGIKDMRRDFVERIMATMWVGVLQ